MHSLASSLRHQRETSALIEQQFQRWLMLQQSQADRSPPCKTVSYGHHITISREAGTGAEQIARAVGDELGWRLLDRELLGLVAQAASCSPSDVELIDETSMRWIAEVFNHWIEHPPVSHEKYFSCLSAVLRAAVRHENVVIVGRGASFLLPREAGLSIRLIAPKRYRTDQVRRLQGMTSDQARAWVEQIDRERRNFIWQHFHHDVNHLHLYDLVVNVEKLGAEGAARQIATAAHELFCG